MVEDDFEFYYFMKYGKMPSAITGCPKPKSSQNLKILRAFVAFFALGFFMVLFIVLTAIGLNIDTDFKMVNVTLRNVTSYYNDTLSNSTLSNSVLLYKTNATSSNVNLSYVNLSNDISSIANKTNS